MGDSTGWGRGREIRPRGRGRWSQRLKGMSRKKRSIDAREPGLELHADFRLIIHVRLEDKRHGASQETTFILNF